VEIKKCVFIGPDEDGDYSFEVETTVKNTNDQDIRLISTSCMLLDEDGIGRGTSCGDEEEVYIEPGKEADVYIVTPYCKVAENSSMIIDACFYSYEVIKLGSYKLPGCGETLTIKNDKLVAGSIQLYSGYIKRDEPDRDGHVHLEITINVRNVSDNYIQRVELKCEVEDEEGCEVLNELDFGSLSPRSTKEIICRGYEKGKKGKNCEAKLSLLVYAPLGTASVEATLEKE